MKEIELKAHVTDRKAVENKISTFAEYEAHIIRDDKYYKLPDCDKPKIRLRKQDQDGNISYFLTYKKRNPHTDENGIKTEVNTELESEITNPAAMETFFIDSGYELILSKHKDVTDYHLDLPGIKAGSRPLYATLELCNVPPLGDFLEVEVLYDGDDEDIVNQVQAELKNIINRAGIPDQQIENRFYSQMIEEAMINQHIENKKKLR